MSRKWVINASPIIVLAKLGQIALFEELCGQMVIPAGVVKEIEQGTDNDPAKTWMNSQGEKYVVDAGQIKQIVSAWDLGLGESEVISWSYEHADYEAILDDRAARKCALSLQIRVRGTLGVLLLAKKKKKLKHVKPLLERLPEVGFRVNPVILREAIRLADE